MIKYLSDGQLDLAVLEIKDVVDVKLLELFHNSFSCCMHVASGTLDKDGNEVIGSGNSRFCMEIIRSSAKGRERCAQCDARAREAISAGRPFVHACHAGLTDFAAPIMVQNELIGAVMGGQILTERLDEQSARRTARELSIDEELYVAELRKVRVIPLADIKAAAEVLFIVANALTRMGYEQLKLSGLSRTLSESMTQIAGTVEELSIAAREVTTNQHALSAEIENIKETVAEINSTVRTVRRLADQTKILGLNAAIEAARAGAIGNAFGVVADEVKSLANTSKETASSITVLTEKIQQSIQITLANSQSTVVATDQQSNAIGETSSTLQKVSDLARELDNLARSNRSSNALEQPVLPVEKESPLAPIEKIDRLATSSRQNHHFLAYSN